MSRFLIDSTRSQVWIEARSSLHPITAQASGLRGWIETDLFDGGGEAQDTEAPVPGTGAHGRLEVDMAALSSGSPLYDREMRRRADVRRFPTIVGELTALRENGRHGDYLATGDLTFRDQTRSYTDRMQVSMSQPDDRELCLEGIHEFDIRDFGLQPPRILTLRVHPEVQVRVLVRAMAEQSAPAPPPTRVPAPDPPTR